MENVRRLLELLQVILWDYTFYSIWALATEISCFETDIPAGWMLHGKKKKKVLRILASKQREHFNEIVYFRMPYQQLRRCD